MERLKLPEPLAAAEREAEQPGRGGRGQADTASAEHRPGPRPEPDAQSDPSIPYDLESPAADPGATTAWAPAAADDAEQYDDTTAAWAAEGDEDPDTTSPYAVDDEYEAPEDEDDPDTTAPWAVDDQEDPGEAPRTSRKPARTPGTRPWSSRLSPAATRKTNPPSPSTSATEPGVRPASGQAWPGGRLGCSRSRAASCRGRDGPARRSCWSPCASGRTTWRTGARSGPAPCHRRADQRPACGRHRAGDGAKGAEAGRPGPAGRRKPRR